VVRHVGISNALRPTHLRNPGRRRVEGALGRGQDGFLAVDVQFDADGTGEWLVHEQSVAQMFWPMFSPAPK
jgi:hypothetical protein